MTRNCSYFFISCVCEVIGVDELTFLLEPRKKTRNSLKNAISNHSEKNYFYCKNCEKYQICVQKCSISPKNPIAVVKNSLNQVLLCVSFANFCASSWEKANGWLWPPPHLNGLLNYRWS